jgi:hypothetical protein
MFEGMEGEGMAGRTSGHEQNNMSTVVLEYLAAQKAEDEDAFPHADDIEAENVMTAACALVCFVAWQPVALP